MKEGVILGRPTWSRPEHKSHSGRPLESWPKHRTQRGRYSYGQRTGYTGKKGPLGVMAREQDNKGKLQYRDGYLETDNFVRSTGAIRRKDITWYN